MTHIHPQFLARSPPNPWNFLKDKNSGIRLGLALNSPPKGRGLVARSTHHLIRGLELSVSSSDTPGAGRDLRLNKLPSASDLVNQDYVLKPPHKKTPKTPFWFFFGALPCGEPECFHVPSCQAPSRREVPLFRTSPDVYLFIWPLTHILQHPLIINE